MFRGNRLLIIAVGLVLCGQAPSAEGVSSPSPTPKNQAANGAQDPERNPKPLAVTIVESSEEAKTGEARQAKGDEHNSRDLDAQIRAADAAEKQIAPSWLAAILSTIGTLLIMWTLALTRKAHAISRDANRAWLSISVSDTGVGMDQHVTSTVFSDGATSTTRDIGGLLKAAGLRPTRQRLLLGGLLFGAGDRHVTAEILHAEAVSSGERVSLATVYNTLHQFCNAGLLRELAIEGSKAYFDTNTSNHSHYMFETTGGLMDIPGDTIEVSGLPEPPEGLRITHIDVVVRLAKK